MGYINDQEWNTRYNTNINDLSEITLKDFQSKINNKILVTKNFLHRIRARGSEGPEWIRFTLTNKEHQLC